jgi:beta-1,2-mannosidase
MIRHFSVTSKLSLFSYLSIMIASLNPCRVFIFISWLLMGSCRHYGHPALQDWTLTDFQKADSVNPVLSPGNGVFPDPVSGKIISWEAKNVFNPAVVVVGDSICLLYRAQDSTGTSRIGIAYSADGMHFRRNPLPVLFPDQDEFKKYEWPGGCEDPRVVEDSAGTYYMTYTAYDGSNARLCMARSRDLLHWQKKGPVFAKAYGGKYLNEWSKSGSIVSGYQNGKIIARRIGGEYWMYWGDQFVWAATSDDLLNWKPVEMNPGETAGGSLRGIAEKMPCLKIVVPVRPKHFDSDLVESGPPAMLTGQGILLLYNGRNIPSIGDPDLPEGTYASGQILLDKDDPSKTIARADTFFMKPSRPYELTGAVNNVCFIEGLAQFQQHYFLYYGTADSKIAVAIR